MMIQETLFNQILQNFAENSSGKIKFFEADLLKEGSFDEAMKDCDWVFHIASPFTLRFKDAEKELLIPALKGTENIIKTANKNLNIKNVIIYYRSNSILYLINKTPNYENLNIQNYLSIKYKGKVIEKKINKTNNKNNLKVSFFINFFYFLFVPILHLILTTL